MPDDGRGVSYPATTEAPATGTEAPQGRSDHPDEQPSVLRSTPRSVPRRWVRGVLFMLLPVAVTAGGYWYTTGSQLMSTDDAYVDPDKVGISTVVSGIVKEVHVTENQHVEAGRVLYRLDHLPFRLALARAEAQVGIVGDALNALKANYRDMQAQIKRAQNDVDCSGTESSRQQDLLSTHADHLS
jgi:membrane fusion protein (multidrug efflux system)